MGKLTCSGVLEGIANTTENIFKNLLIARQFLKKVGTFCAILKNLWQAHPCIFFWFVDYLLLLLEVIVHYKVISKTNS